MKGKPIQDVTPPEKQNFDTIPDEVFVSAEVTKLPTKVLVEELFNRGVTIQHIFSQFYALEENGLHQHDELLGSDEEGQHGRKPLTIEDAAIAGALVGLELPKEPKPRQQPF